MRPNTRFTWSGGYAIAYQVVGDGVRDLVYLPGWASNVDVSWDVPPIARFLERLSSFSRLILLDRRGVGCSDRYTPDASPPLEEMADDVLAVMDAVGSRSATIFGVQDTAFIAMMLAASAPKRVSSLVLYGASAAWTKNEEMPWEWSAEQWEEMLSESTELLSAFELADEFLRDHLPSLAADPTILPRLASLILSNQPPGAWTAEGWRWSQVDVRDLLPTIQAPTLVLCRKDDHLVPVEAGRYLAGKIPGARLIELEGTDVQPWAGDTDAVLTEVEAFVTRRTLHKPETPEPEERMLATVLFTDIVGSTERAVALGDRGWRELVEQHHAEVRGILSSHRGVEVDTAGDGFFATFDGPARAVRSAVEICRRVRELGLEVRAGVHTGEVETIAGKVGGIAANIGARVCARPTLPRCSSPRP